MSIFGDARRDYHSALINAGVYVNVNGKKGWAASNADQDSPSSVKIGNHLAAALSVKNAAERLKSQTVGAEFEKHTNEFLRQTFLLLDHLRPGSWEIDRVSTRGSLNIANYDQYSHLKDVNDAVKENPSLRVLLGEDYIIASDIILARNPVKDDVVNLNANLVDGKVANRAALREVNNNKPTLHACVSCKWTMRSDRVQNSRFEALRLIRSRKGRVPHLAVVTAEPLPSRIASIALGTGDIDCVYHIALPELIEAVASIGQSEAASLLDLMVEGKRLKDIADLPLDLAI